MEFTIRNANARDLVGIMAVEEAWPEDQRSTRDKFIARLEIFPEGFWVVEVAGKIVAVSTCTLTHYDANDIGSFKTWEQCTNNGMLYPLTNKEDYNAMYIVSTGILVEARSLGIREALIQTHLNLAKKLKKQYVVTGAMIPGYDAYCNAVGEVPASEYAFILKDGKPIDPTLKKLKSLGLELPNPSHIISNFYQSVESRDHGALLVCDIPNHFQNEVE